MTTLLDDNQIHSQEEKPPKKPTSFILIGLIFLGVLPFTIVSWVVIHDEASDLVSIGGITALIIENGYLMALVGGLADSKNISVVKSTLLGLLTILLFVGSYSCCIWYISQISLALAAPFFSLLAMHQIFKHNNYFNT